MVLSRPRRESASNQLSISPKKQTMQDSCNLHCQHLTQGDLYSKGTKSDKVGQGAPGPEQKLKKGKIEEASHLKSESTRQRRAWKNPIARSKGRVSILNFSLSQSYPQLLLSAILFSSSTRFGCNHGSLLVLSAAYLLCRVTIKQFFMPLHYCHQCSALSCWGVRKAAASPSTNVSLHNTNTVQICTMKMRKFPNLLQKSTTVKRTGVSLRT